MTIIITTGKTVDVTIIMSIITAMKDIAVVTAMTTMATITIMQTRYSRAGEKRLPTNTQTRSFLSC